MALPAHAPLGSIMQEIAASDEAVPPPLFSGGVYSSPGGAFDFDCGNSSADLAWKLDSWPNQTASAYRKAGFNLSTAATFALADEPGWYFPAVLSTVKWPSRVMDSWHSFLKNASLSPADVGATSFDKVLPIGRSKATALSLRRLYYWTCRFFSVYRYVGYVCWLLCLQCKVM